MKNYVDAKALQEYTTKLVAKLKTLFPGTPTAAATVAEMTDHSKTYVYVGTESGYTAGDWYYWNGTAWTSGGPFQATSIITDTTLAVAGEAADAKATGDAIAAAKTAVLNAMAPAYSISGTYAVGDYVNHNGAIYRCTTAITTGEAWTSGHWAAVTLGADLEDQVGALKESLIEISETGKNLFNKNNPNIINAAANRIDLIYRSNPNVRTVWIECEPNTTYTISKQAGTNFIVAYGSIEPSVGAEFEYCVRYATNSAITVTTSATAKYLSALVWTTSDSVTLEQMLATVQFEQGASATEYEPYELSADDEYARGILAGMQKHLSVTSDYLEAVTGDEVFSGFENMTPIGGAVYNDGKWQLPENGGVSKTVNIQGATTYLITLGVDLNSIVVSDYSTNYTINPLTVTLGNATLDIFAYVDANWLIALKPTAASTGDVTFSVQCNGTLALDLESISIKPVLQYADNPITVNGIDIGGYDTNFVAGNGQKKTVGGYRNVAVGKDAQLNINTGYANTAVGFHAQRSILDGRANTAIGHRAQAGLTTGMYNNAIGTASQAALTCGSWNNALGNETQRDTTTGCNNVAIGRRAQSYLTTGNHNVAIGAMAGFNRFGTTGGHGAVATTTASYQVLVGGEATQKSSTPADYLIAVGYMAHGDTNGIAIGARSEAGANGIAIGTDAKAGDNEVVIGNKKIIFNSDGTVTWEAVT